MSVTEYLITYAIFYLLHDYGWTHRDSFSYGLHGVRVNPYKPSVRHVSCKCILTVGRSNFDPKLKVKGHAMYFLVNNLFLNRWT